MAGKGKKTKTKKQGKEKVVERTKAAISWGEAQKDPEKGTKRSSKEKARDFGAEMFGLVQSPPPSKDLK